MNKVFNFHIEPAIAEPGEIGEGVSGLHGLVDLEGPRTIRSDRSAEDHLPIRMGRRVAPMRPIPGEQP